ncbi:recombinase family protein [uncultured Mitsuokella sp.]|uniref:recombinase family protein n=1 Tax=uncultured Mitsuokella sp. TaxID=453120 RepID=UPI00261C61B0|nr:recombinase family protein [uncultured Mitsuokella sp.]
MNVNNIHGTKKTAGIEVEGGGIAYGYIRVSTAPQHDDRQRMAMEEFGISADCLFADKQSGKDFDRPAYNAMMARLTSGDTVVVKSLDRLGRDYEEMIRQLDIITREKDAAIIILDMPLIDTRRKQGDDLTGKFISNLVIQIFSYVAHMERSMNHQRTMEGLAAARARGVRFGRRPLEKPEGYEEIRRKWKNGEISEREAARRLGVSRPTFHKWVHEE